MTTLGTSVETRLDEVERSRSTDVPARLAEARDLEREAQSTGGALLMRARLVVADMVHRTGDIADGLRIASEVRAWAELHADRWVLARAHLVLSSMMEGIGDPTASLDHAISAVEVLGEGGRPRDRGVLLLRLGDALALNTSVEEARARYDEAEAVFIAAGERFLRLTTLNNLTMLEWEAGEVQAAAAAAERLYRACADEDRNADFDDTIARARLLAGDLKGADEIVRRGMELWQTQGDSQAATPADLTLTHARIRLALGDVAGAVERLDECLRICAQRELHGVRVQALEVRAETLAVAGDFEAAYLTYRAFHEESELRRSQRREAAARARHAVLQTEQARRQARQFWEQARRDPLTGLYNRRYVDERLPGLLDLPDEDRGRLIAAVVDVDHFKQINDRFSHDVGDEVLRRLAVLLDSCPAAPDDEPFAVADFVARLGGEEFLAVLGRGSVDQALADVEALRRRVEAHDWADVAPGLSVTISAGVAVAGSQEMQRSLLTRADGHLYEAKRTGRNRVVSDPTD